MKAWARAHAQGRLPGGSSEDGNELEGASEGEVGADLEDGLDREDEVADILGACPPAPLHVIPLMQ